MKPKLTKEELFLLTSGVMTVKEMAAMKGLSLNTVYTEIRGYAPRRVSHEVRAQLRQDLLLTDSVKLVLASWGFKTVPEACRVAGIRSLRSWRDFDPSWPKLIKKQGLTLKGYVLRGEQSVRLAAEEMVTLKQFPKYWLRENEDVVRRCNTPPAKIQKKKPERHYRLIAKYQKAAQAYKLVVEGFTVKQMVEVGISAKHAAKCRKALKAYRDWETEIFTNEELEKLRELGYYGAEE